MGLNNGSSKEEGAMANNSFRDWISKLEEGGHLKRITAEVDWNLELSAIAREVLSYRGPALLFENFWPPVLPLVMSEVKIWVQLKLDNF